MRKVVIVSAVRTALGSLGGNLKEVNPEELTKIVLLGALKQAKVKKEMIDEVIIGQTKQSSDAPNIARVASLMAGIPESVPAYTVHRQCASGMQAILNAFQQVQTGYSDIVLAGGVESMSTAPFYMRGARFGVGNGNSILADPNTESQPNSQPANIYGHFNMIETAENIAKKYNIDRLEQDAFALESQRRAIEAIDSGKFDDEIVPVMIPQRKNDALIFDVDEYPRRDTDESKMARLKPIIPGGTVTAGNASGRNDGSSALLIMSEDKARELNLQPLVYIIGASAVGVDPRFMGMGPVEATRKLLIQLDMTIDQFGLYEINEAFASQTLACLRQLQMDPSRLNVNGGAIALGHPLGCSGARIATTLIHEMMKQNTKFGLATICVAGGLGMAMAFQLA